MDRVLVTAGAIVVLGSAIVVLVRGLLWAARGWRKVAEFLDDWRGEDARPGHDRRKGVPERLADMERGLAEVRGQLKPNAGKSLRDAIDRVETAVSENGATLLAHPTGPVAPEHEQK